MACYDCEDCNRSTEYGGKCDRWEYNCPFKHLISWNEAERQKIDIDLNVAKELNSELILLINKYKNQFNDWYNYEESIKGLERIQDNLDDMVSDFTINEWKKINSKEEK